MRKSDKAAERNELQRLDFEILHILQVCTFTIGGAHYSRLIFRVVKAA